MQMRAWPEGVLIAAAVGLAVGHGYPAFAAGAVHSGSVQVSGTGTDIVSGAIVHSKTHTDVADIQESTEIIELQGDLVGKVLYHVTTSIDTQHKKLVNRGDQVFSGTVAGSAPVMLMDNQFHFEVDLSTGKDAGEVFLVKSLAGPKVGCTLHVEGTGHDEQSNPTFKYIGTCHFRS